LYTELWTWTELGGQWYNYKPLLNSQEPPKSAKTIAQGAENEYKTRFSNHKTHHEHGMLVDVPEPHNI
jgi:hypothetical protein